MTTSLSHLISEAQSPSQDVRVFRPSFRAEPFFAPVVIRMATAADGPALERLAQLDSAPGPPSEPLVGEVQGRLVVAVSMHDGQAVSDPFMATGSILELVRLRAEQLRPRSRRARHRPQQLRPRFAS